MATLQHRHGMVYLEQDGDSISSGEFLAESTDGSNPPPTQHIQPPSIIRGRTVGARRQRPSIDSSSRCSSRGADTEESYDDVYSSSGEDSYHSECDDIAQYWDPYCKIFRVAWSIACGSSIPACVFSELNCCVVYVGSGWF